MFDRSDRTRCLQSAIHMLSRREHSRRELENKLGNKPCAESIDLNALLDELENSGYLSDQRFSEMFVRYRISRGQGPQKIQYELSQRGVMPSLVEESMQLADVDWFELAKEQREKRFGVEFPKDYKEQAKQSRFLAGRGFFSDTIHMIFNRQ